MSGEQLSQPALAAALGERPFRTYPALLSTEAEAQAWARADGPSGAVVVAGHQASPRGRGGMPWRLRPDRDLCFSMVLRPDLRPEREGWLYTIAASSLAQALGEDVEIEWPDQLHRGAEPVGAAAVHAWLGPERVEWAVVTFRVDDAPRPWPPLVARIAGAVEAAAAREAGDLLDDYRRRCLTLGREVSARLAPVGGEAPRVEGRADALRGDGTLVVATPDGRRLALRPQFLQALDSPRGEDR